MKSIVCVLTVILLLLAVLPSAGPCISLDEGIALYDRGAGNYDPATLEKALGAVRRVQGGKTFVHHLFEGMVLLRLQFVYYIKGDLKRSASFGMRAEKALLKAQETSPDSLEPVAYCGLVYQYLSLCGAKYRGRYGVKARKIINLCGKVSPEHFFSRYLAGVGACESPRPLGGNPEKAVKILTALRADFPDDEDIRIYLGQAYLKVNNYDMAFSSLRYVLAKNSENLFAKKVLNAVLAQMK